MAEADAEDGDVFVEGFDDFWADAAFLRAAGAGGDEDFGRFEFGDFFDGDFVVWDDEGFLFEGDELLVEVVGEGVVVINEENHWASFRNSLRVEGSLRKDPVQ